MLRLFLLMIASFTVFSFSSCKNNRSAEITAQKWCSCNKEMGQLMKEFQNSEDESLKSKLAVNILDEQQKVIECMGGDKELQALNLKYRGTDFQQVYNKKRSELCPDLLKLLNNKSVK